MFPPNYQISTHSINAIRSVHCSYKVNWAIEGYISSRASIFFKTTSKVGSVVLTPFWFRLQFAACQKNKASSYTSAIITFDFLRIALQTPAFYFQICKPKLSKPSNNKRFIILLHYLCEYPFRMAAFKPFTVIVYPTDPSWVSSSYSAVAVTSIPPAHLCLFHRLLLVHIQRLPCRIPP
jgi:hypothetical protein